MRITKIHANFVHANIMSKRKIVAIVGLPGSGKTEATSETLKK